MDYLPAHGEKSGERPWRKLRAEELREQADAFYGIEVKGVRFVAAATLVGPHLCVDPGRNQLAGEVPLGHCACLYEMSFVGRLGWALCKYESDQVFAFFEGWDAGDANLVSAQFGVLLPGLDVVGDFYLTPAWHGLQQWVSDNPGKAKRFGSGPSNVGDWYGAAVSASKGFNQS